MTTQITELELSFNMSEKPSTRR